MSPGSGSTGFESTGFESTDSGSTSSESSGSESSDSGALPACPPVDWQTTLPQIDSAIAVAADGIGAVYVLGTLTGGPTTDAWIGALDESTGALLWSSTIDPMGAGVADVDETALGLRLHSSGDLIIAVDRSDPSSPAGVLRYDPGVDMVDWFTVLGPADLSPDTTSIQPRFVATSQTDVIVMAGKEWLTTMVSSGTGQWLARLDDLDGSVTWVSRRGLGSDTLSTSVVGLAIDDAMGIYTASESDCCGTHSSDLHRWSLVGDWQQDFGYTSNFMGVPHYLHGLAVSDGELVAAYTDHFPSSGTEVTLDRRDGALALISTGVDGQPVSDRPTAAVTDATGTAFVVGYHPGLAWVRAFDATGSLEWYATAPSADRYVAAATLPGGSLLASGYSGPDAVVHRYGSCLP